MPGKTCAYDLAVYGASGFVGTQTTGYLSLEAVAASFGGAASDLGLGSFFWFWHSGGVEKTAKP